MKLKLMCIFIVIITLTTLITGCNKNEQNTDDINQGENNGETVSIDTVGTENENNENIETTPVTPEVENITTIELSDTSIKVDGKSITHDINKAVYLDYDIIFYEEGNGFIYGEGTEDDEHSKKEASTHSVVHISKPGTYKLEGKLSKGQIAIDLGEEAILNKDSKVEVILNNVDITCEIAPAIVVYNVYECGTTVKDLLSNNVDTTNAGITIRIADDSINNIQGSYVSRIYDPETVESMYDVILEAETLHDYAGAIHSKMSLNICGDKLNNGVLNIKGEKEGLHSGLHLTINGGVINITSENNGINTSLDDVSVTTLNSGEVNISVIGENSAGDGIKSAGWIVINGGKITACASELDEHLGFDSVKGIHINGGEVIATGNMYSDLETNTKLGKPQTYAVLTFSKQLGDGEYIIKNNTDSTEIIKATIENKFNYLLVSSDKLTDGEYTIEFNGEELQVVKTETFTDFESLEQLEDQTDTTEDTETSEDAEASEDETLEDAETSDNETSEDEASEDEAYDKSGDTTNLEDENNTKYNKTFIIEGISNFFIVK